jgi:putative peptidoglycan lipid II flippase
MIFPIRLVGVPIGQAALPFLADLSDEANLSRFKKILIQSLNQISFLAFPAAALILILRIPAVRLVYGTKNFPWEMTVLVGRIVAIMALSIPIQAMYHLLVRSFYALKNTKIPFLISTVTTILFVVGCYLATLSGDQNTALLDIALVISVVALVEVASYFFFLHRRLKPFFTNDFLISQGKIIFASAIMTIALYIPFKFLDQLVFDTTRVLPLLALTVTTSLLGIGVFILVAYLIKIKEMELVRGVLKNFGLVKKEAGPTFKSSELLDRTVDVDEMR